MAEIVYSKTPQQMSLTDCFKAFKVKNQYTLTLEPYNKQ